MVHVPVVSVDTAAPATEHTAGVFDDNETGRPDDADALGDPGVWSSVTSDRLEKVIDCGALETAKLCCTEVAAAKTASPA